MSRSLSREPMSSEKEPERQARITPVTLEAALDRPIADRALPAEQPSVRRASPGIEDEPVVSTQHQHDVRRGVGPNTRQRLQPSVYLVVRQIIVRGSCERRELH